MYSKAAATIIGILAIGLTIRAQTQTVSFGPAQDRAGPLFGMSITIDAAETDTALLTRVSFRHTDRETGLGDAKAYLHVYDAFATDDQYVPSTIGKLVAVSTNTVDFATAESDTLLTWHFDHAELDPTKEYHYIFSITARAATMSNHSNLATSAFRLDPTNPYPGGQVWRAYSHTGSPSTDWDMEFELAWEPKTKRTAEAEGGTQTEKTSYGPASDRAGPLYGMSITISTNTVKTVQVEQVSFRHTDGGTGLGTDTVYLHVYDAFATDDQYVPSTIGKLIAVSTNTVDFTQAPAGSLLTWNFDHAELDPQKEYFYLFATNTDAATMSDHSNLSSSAFKLDATDPYSGGRAWRAYSPYGTPSEHWDMEFQVVWKPKPTDAGLSNLPKFSPVIIIGAIGLLFIRGKWKR